MHLDLHEGARAWKGYPWDVLDLLFEQGLITDPRGKARSVVLTDKGLRRAADSFGILLATDSVSGQRRSVGATLGGLPDIQRARVEALLQPLCQPHPDPAVSSKLRVGYRIERGAVVLFESRPSFSKPKEWQEEVVAKFKFNKTRETWQLCCMFRDLKWHAYQPLPESPDIARLVAEVRTDPTGIFWG
jgi:hypothetical protein